MQHILLSYGDITAILQNLYGTMNRFMWVYCFFLYAFITCCPLGVAPTAEKVTGIYAWGYTYQGAQTFHIWSAFFGYAMYMFILYPTCSLLARWTTGTSWKRTQRAVRSYEIFLYVLEVVFSIIIICYIGIFVAGPSGIPLSPGFWLLLANNALLLYQLEHPFTKACREDRAIEMS